MLRCVVLALSAYDDVHYVGKLLANGAAGYLTKEEAPEMILESVRGVARGEVGWDEPPCCAPHERGHAASNPTESELSGARARGPPPHRDGGKTNQEIGYGLKISEKTVEKHVGSILAKMDVSSWVEAAVKAIQRGLVP